MDFFGIGNLELVVILLVALLVLGPERMLEVARSVGRFWREAQRTVRYAIDSVTVEEEQKPNPVPRDPLPEPEDAVSRPEQRRYVQQEDGALVPVDEAPTPEETAQSKDGTDRG